MPDWHPHARCAAGPPPRKNIEKIDGVQLPVGELDITLYRDDLSTVADAPVLNRTDIPFPIAGKTVVLVATSSTPAAPRAQRSTP